VQALAGTPELGEGKYRASNELPPLLTRRGGQGVRFKSARKLFKYFLSRHQQRNNETGFTGWNHRVHKKMSDKLKCGINVVKKIDT
jgi:hypothetical protein